MVRLLVNNRHIETQAGVTVLQACLDNGIYIPNLCYLKGMDDPPGSCRLCLVEINGYDQPITSCTVEVKEGMIIKTTTEHVKRLQRSAFELLLSVHRVDCRRCPAHKNCELQRIARYLHFGLKLKRLEQLKREVKAEEDHPCLEYVPSRCVLCGRCVSVCQREHGQAMLSFAGRGLDTVVSFFGEEEGARETCGQCYACVETCPVGALLIKTPIADNTNIKRDSYNDKGKR